MMSVSDFQEMICEINLDLLLDDDLTKSIQNKLEQANMEAQFIRKRRVLDEIESLCEEWLKQHRHQFGISEILPFLKFQKSIKERRSSMGSRSLSKSSSFDSIDQETEVRQYHRNNWKILREGLTPLFQGTGRRIVDIHKYVGENRRGVQYLDEKQRKALEVTASGGLFKDHSGALLDTSKMETSDAGAGWAAFVVSGNYKLYVHSHLSGRFHHSSFLAGGRVLAAGEISIIQGNLVAISRKSGHYQPDDHMLFFFLSWLSRRNVNLNHIPVRLSVQEPIMYYDACQIMYNGGNSKGLIPIEGPITNI